MKMRMPSRLLKLKIKSSLAIGGLISLIYFFFIFFWTFLNAYRSPLKMTPVYINIYGEANIELVIFALLGTLFIPMIVMIFRDLYKIWTEEYLSIIQEEWQKELLQ